jgi:membrane-associated phospholipid phosphatase
MRTKISAHVGVISGIFATLYVMGNLRSLPLVAGATAWARVVTGHHTVLQVRLGIVVSAVSVGAAFVLMALFQACWRCPLPQLTASTCEIDHRHFRFSPLELPKLTMPMGKIDPPNFRN